jgi:hypothetical protein
MAKPRLCLFCDRELQPEDRGICKTCAGQEQRDQQLSLPGVREEPLFDPRSPTVGLHIAGPQIDKVQRCVRCGDVLAAEKKMRGRPVPHTRYPEGALIERGRGWQAMCLRVGASPTCEARETVHE